MHELFVIFRLHVVGVFTSFQCLKFLCSIPALTLHSHQYAVNLPWEHRTEGLILGSDTIVSVSRSNKISCSPKEIFVKSPEKRWKSFFVCVNHENWETALSISVTQTLFFFKVTYVWISAMKSPPELSCIHTVKNAYSYNTEVYSRLSSPYCLALLPIILNNIHFKQSADLRTVPSMQWV